MQRQEKKKESVTLKNSPGKKWHKKHLKSIKVALVYDRVNKFGGAERVLLALHKIFPKAPLFTSVYYPKKAPWAKVFKVKTSFLQKIPLARNHHEIFAPLMSIAFRNFKFSNYDIVISVTSESAKAIQVRGKTLHICICLTPTRYLWSGYKEYFPNDFIRRIIFPMIWVLRLLDKQAAKKPNMFLAISLEVQRRIKKYYKRDSQLLYPPILLHSYVENPIFMLQEKSYYLVVSRISKFTNYKRIDLAVKAASKLNVPLIVIGQGDTSYLEKIAGPSVQFLHTVSDAQLQWYYRNAKALIFPGKEDFGLVMIEAQMAGTPVIAYKAGGALEIIKEGKTGEFFATQSVSSLVGVLKSFGKKRYNSYSCKENAKWFSFSYFEKSLKEYILKALAS